MNEYPRTWVIRKGPDAGKVLIQWAPEGAFSVVGPDGGVDHRYRAPISELVQIAPADAQQRKGA